MGSTREESDSNAELSEGQYDRRNENCERVFAHYASVSIVILRTPRRLKIDRRNVQDFFQFGDATENGTWRFQVRDITNVGISRLSSIMGGEMRSLNVLVHIRDMRSP